MQNIIGKLKAATGPSQDLDREIFEAIAGNGVFNPENRKFWRPAGLSTREPLDFTSSLDDAVKLIPEGMFWILGYGQNTPGEPIGGAQVFRPNEDDPIGEGEADNLVLALCIAALEAHATIQCNHQPVEVHEAGCTCPLCQQADALERAGSIQH